MWLVQVERARTEVVQIFECKACDHKIIAQRPTEAHP